MPPSPRDDIEAQGGMPAPRMNIAVMIAIAVVVVVAFIVISSRFRRPLLVCGLN